MAKADIRAAAGKLLERVRREEPLVHHITNWVTISDCADIVKAAGASPIMAHAKEEVAEMANLSSALVLNIGTLTAELVEAMKIAARSANKKGIPVVLDACGAGATKFRDKKCFELLDEVKIDILKGNSSEIARLCGADIRTKGVDSSGAVKNIAVSAKKLAKKRKCVVVVTGKEDIVTDGKKTYLINYGHPMMADIVGTGCMAASMIGAFAAVERDLALASASALVCFETAAELAAKDAKGPADFKNKIKDRIYNK